MSKIKISTSESHYGTSSDMVGQVILFANSFVSYVHGKDILAAFNEAAKSEKLYKGGKLKKAEATKGYLVSKNPNHSILSNQSLTEKKFKELCENFIPSLEKLCEGKSGKVILELDYPGEYNIKATIDVELSESNKPSTTTRAGKILESLNKRTRKLNEGKAVFKIVMPADSHNPQRAEYYDSNEGMEFAQDIKNLMKGAGAYKKKGDDWVFVKGTDVLGLKSKGTSAAPKKKSILKRLFRR